MIVSAPWDARSSSKSEPNTPGGSISNHATTPVRKRADKLKAGDYIKGPKNKPVEILSIEEGVNQDGRKCRILRLYKAGNMVVKDWKFLDTYPQDK